MACNNLQHDRCRNDEPAHNREYLHEARCFSLKSRRFRFDFAERNPDFTDLAAGTCRQYFGGTLSADASEPENKKGVSSPPGRGAADADFPGYARNLANGDGFAGEQ